MVAQGFSVDKHTASLTNDSSTILSPRVKRITAKKSKKKKEHNYPQNLQNADIPAIDIFGIQKAQLHERKSSKASIKEGSQTLIKHSFSQHDDIDRTGNSTEVRGISETLDNSQESTRNTLPKLKYGSVALRTMLQPNAISEKSMVKIDSDMDTKKMFNYESYALPFIKQK